jgi:hypothetical protein
MEPNTSALPASIDPNRLVLCLWYLEDQSRFYLDYFSDFETTTEAWVADKIIWLRQRKPIQELLPDICGGCLQTWAPTIGGRVRIVCPRCYDNSWTSQYLLYDYRCKMAEILNVSEHVLESYLALALWFKKITGPMRTTNQPESQREQGSRSTDARIA